MKARFLAWTALLCLVAGAKTVALWPLETVETDGGVRCVIDPQNDLSINTGHKSNTGTNAMWALPPNPDTDRHAIEPINHSAVRETFSGEGKGFLYNNHTGRFLRRDKAFTIEGWMKVLALPASNEWACILGAYGKLASDGSDVNRWTFSLRRRSNEDYACSWIFWGHGTQDTVLYRYADEEASYAITNTWLHVALTHEPFRTNHRDYWTLYLNGEKVGESDNYGIVTNSYVNHRFDLGARADGNQLEAVFDYWRISDKVLAPSEFLCAGDSSGTPAPAASHTVSYWPLGATSNGGIDCRDAVGNSPLSGGFATAYVPNRMTPVEDCAFTGNPPNSTATLPNGNAGSFLGCATASCLQQNNVGAYLNVSSNFTVEGWFCPRICERDIKTSTQETCCYLFGTRPDYQKGWSFQYRAKGINKFQFDLYCHDGNTLINNLVLSGEYDMNSWYDQWRHVALTYSATGGSKGFGVWTLYIDGEQVGSASNARAPVEITDSRPFILGGRAGIVDQSFQGKIDCVRVCATVLSPAQFLNAEDGAAATDVVGFWPLNVENGAYPDLRDVSGRNNHFASRDNFYSVRLASADPDNAPVISNPDSTLTFRGDPSSVNGSVRFRNPDASTDNNQANLMTYSSDVMNAIAGGKDFTFEFYYLRRRSNKNVSGDQEVFFCMNDSSNNAKIRFFRKSNGFYMWENWNGSLADTPIAGTGDSDLEYDRWYHVALVHSVEPVNDVSSSVWRIYLDGVLKGQPSCSRNSQNGSTQRLYVGGRWSGNNAVIGNLSSVRLSNCALDPSDFLCATPAPVVKPDPTVAYWPIDSVQPGLANLVDAEYPLEADGTAAGQAEPARLSIPNKHALTNVVMGAARQNHGSYALGEAGVLAAASIGFDMAGPKSFTVEGWLNWTPAEGTVDEDLVSVGDAATYNGGLRIYFDKTGASPKLRVFARGAWPCTPYVDGTFDADLTPYLGTWVHVAIAYDANDGEGSWTLYVEGKQAGSKVKNFYRPTSIDYARGGDFRIGSTTHPLSAAVDMWRVSTVAYAPEDLLYAPPSGALIIFR